MNRLGLFLISITLVALLSLAGCGGGEKKLKAEELVPRDANLIASIKVGELIKDAGVADIYEGLPKDEYDERPDTFEDLLDLAEEETGVDFRVFTRVTVFGDVGTFDSDLGYFGVIAEGTFKEREMIESFEKASEVEFATSSYKGFTIYQDEDDESFGITFLREGLLVLGSPDAIKDVINVNEGDEKGVSGAALDTYKSLGDVMVKVAVKLPSSVTEQIVEGISEESSDFPFNLDVFTDIDLVGFSADKRGEKVSFKLMGTFSNKESVQDAEDAVNGLISLFTGFIDVDEVKKVLRAINITSKGSTLTIALDTTVSDLEGLVGALQEFGSE